MSRLIRNDDGGLRVEGRTYALEVSRDGLACWLLAPDGARRLCLRAAAALDQVAAADETLGLDPPAADERPDGAVVVEVRRRSTIWRAAATRIVCADEWLEVVSRVDGEGALGDVHLLGFRALFADGPTGFQGSISNLRTLFTPNPGDAARIVRPAGDGADLGVAGDGALGRGHTAFTPPPLYLALADGEVDDPRAPGAGWLDLGLAAPLEQLTFSRLAYVAADRLCSLRLDYDGHTAVEGVFETPTVVITPSVPDPYRGLRRHRDDLARRAAAPPVVRRDVPAWWAEPIFCGWGAQNHLARQQGVPAGAVATQSAYDGFLAVLDKQGVRPGTVVIDDKWQLTYGANEPDPAKWPDLRAWIAARHGEGRRVLLWWKAWDPEGIPPELCVCTPERTPVGIDPSNPAARDFVAESVGRLLGPGGLDADGLKIDFTARTPAGRALLSHGGTWGIALLHALLRVVRDAAKGAKPDALLVTQTPHPAFADVTDMLRLNDMLRMDDPGPATVVAQMRHRAAVVAAACPEVLLDTDDWQPPDRDAWRAYLEAKTRLGVPALYYATHLDSTGEPLEAEDYAALRHSWAAWRTHVVTRPAAGA